VLTAWVEVVAAAAGVWLASDVAASSAACTVIAAAVATCGATVPLAGIVQAASNTAIAKDNVNIFFIFFIQIKSHIA
jgi:hypothetical protein